MIELFQYTFFQNALLASFLASALCAMVGTYIVTRRLVFVGGGVAHASLGGVGLGALFGFSPLFGASLFSLFSGFGIQWLSNKNKVREDSAIAMLWTFGMSIGIICAYLAPGFMSDLPSFLFGNILAVNTIDLLALIFLLFSSIVFFIFRLRAIVTVAYDSDFAQSQNISVFQIETFMTILICLTIVCCLHIAGIVMVISLLSVPQMTAALFSRTFLRMVWLSFVFGLLGSFGGLSISYVLNVPSGASIILCSILIYFVSKAIKSLFHVINK